jgi:hypothetical protein
MGGWVLKQNKGVLDPGGGTGELQGNALDHRLQGCDLIRSCSSRDNNWKSSTLSSLETTSHT